jgi:hypothetical protein
MVQRLPRSAAAHNARLALGDLYLGPLAQPQAALRAYDDALAAQPPDAVREEALAGRARALRALGRRDDARTAAAAYVQGYPEGVHAPEMRALGR